MPTLILPAKIDLPQIAQLQAQWLDFLRAFDDDELVIDALAVEKIDIAGLQLLLALHRYQSQHNRGVRWLGASAALQSAAKHAGLSLHLFVT